MSETPFPAPVMRGMLDAKAVDALIAEAEQEFQVLTDHAEELERQANENWDRWQFAITEVERVVVELAAEVDLEVEALLQVAQREADATIERARAEADALRAQSRKDQDSLAVEPLGASATTRGDGDSDWSEFDRLMRGWGSDSRQFNGVDAELLNGVGAARRLDVGATDDALEQIRVLRARLSGVMDTAVPEVASQQVALHGAPDELAAPEVVTPVAPVPVRGTTRSGTADSAVPMLGDAGMGVSDAADAGVRDELLPTDFWDEPTTSVASRVRGTIPRSALIQIAGVILLIAVLIVRG